LYVAWLIPRLFTGVVIVVCRWKVTVQLNCDASYPLLSSFPCKLVCFRDAWLSDVTRVFKACPCLQLSSDAIVAGQLMLAFPSGSASDDLGEQVDESLPGDVKQAPEGYLRNLVRHHAVRTVDYVLGLIQLVWACR
jgi:hypothetical protein